MKFFQIHFGSSNGEIIPEKYFRKRDNLSNIVLKLGSRGHFTSLSCGCANETNKTKPIFELYKTAYKEIYHLCSECNLFNLIADFK